MLLPLVIETDGREGLNDLILVSENALVRKDELEDRGILFAAIDVVLDVEGADLVGGWEALDLTVSDKESTRRIIYNGRCAAYPFVIARIKVDFPVPFLPQRP